MSKIVLKLIIALDCAGVLIGYISNNPNAIMMNGFIGLMLASFLKED